MAGVAILLTIPAIYLPFKLQNVYKRVMSLIAFKSKDFKIVAKLMRGEENE
jgi:hypothetical protein